MEKETKVTDIKNLRKSITAAKAKVEAEDNEEVEAEEVATIETKKEVPNRITPVTKEPLEDATAEDDDEEDGEVFDDTEITEEEIIKALRESFPQAPEKYEPAPFLKQLLDPENNEPIEFEDVTGEIIAFEQVALIPKDDKLYAILKPIDFESFNIKDDEAFVYSVEYDYIYYEDYLERVTDEVDVEIIFQMYYDLLDEQGIE